jgi:hypothetical protein
MENKNEWIIGREGDIKVPGEYSYAGRKHARLTRGAEGWFIEDLDSRAGTHVNGKPVRKKQIGVQDKITLGAGYVFDFRTFVAQLPMSDAEFTHCFHRLKEVYDTYSRVKLRIQSQSQGKMMLKRSIPMAVPGILMAAAGGGGIVMLIAGAVFSALAMIIGSVWGSKEMEKIPERLWHLDEQFKIDYACPCPKCRKPFGAHNSWESLRRQGQCPFCRRRFNAE